MTQDDGKKAAAEAALRMVEDGMVLGLGTGSTAAVFVDLLISRVKREGLKLVGIPTSEKTAEQATTGGIPLTDFANHPTIDITFDGADIVDRKTFALLKGLGGALLREKIVAQASRKLVIMVDPSKMPDHFGGILPVEIVRFGYEATVRRLEAIAPYKIRMDKAKPAQFFLTDSGNYIADLDLPVIEDPTALQNSVKSIAGVVETGLFIDMAETVIIGTEQGAQVLARPGR